MKIVIAGDSGALLEKEIGKADDFINLAGMAVLHAKPTSK